MNDDRPQPGERKYDLAERTARFGEAAILFCKTVKRNSITQPLIRQLVRSSTSVGANYLEADEAGSKKEFRYRISVCKRECRETQHWLRLLVVAAPECTEIARTLWKEAQELILIFGTIHRKSKITNAE